MPFENQLPLALENDIQKGILEYLKLRGVFAIRINSGAAFMKGRGGKLRPVKFNSGEGTSDILGLLPGGRFVAIECKRPGERPTSDQQAFIDRVNSMGGLAFVAASIDDVQSHLQDDGQEIIKW